MKVIATITFDNDPSPQDIGHIQHILDNDFKHRPMSVEVTEVISD